MPPPAPSTGSASPSARSTSPRPASTSPSRRSRTPPTRALAAARAEVRANGAQTPPDYLRDAHYPGAEELGRGEGYRYAHDEPDGVGDQQLLPPGLEGARFYAPTDRGFEAELGSRLERLRARFEKS